MCYSISYIFNHLHCETITTPKTITLHSEGNYLINICYSITYTFNHLHYEAVILLRNSHFTAKQSLYTYDVKALERNYLRKLKVIILYI